MPHEIAIGEIYVPPLMLVAVLAYVVTGLLSLCLAKLGVYSLLVAPAVAELSVFVVVCALIGMFIPFV
ncbi:DUF1656 domain-containing protein [Shewanella sp. Scap07]|nr:DUF1656 domain-containing protein [Shewanella sp. Scap07]